jgi:phospholipase C
MTRRTTLIASATLLAVGLATGDGPALAAGGAVTPARGPGPQDTVKTATPIKHLVILFHENVSFDHYFATYPKAANPPGEPAFTAKPRTPKVNNLANAGLLTHNPNTNPANGADAALPFRLDRTQASTADQNHAYTAEQQAYHGGKADLFPKYTGRGSPGGAGAFGTKGQVMGYFDGNTVTAMWHYAQNFAMSDNAYTDTYGPSTPGALEVASAQTNGMKIAVTSKKPSTLAKVSYYIADGHGGWTMINDVDPDADVCSSKTDRAMMDGENIGDLLNAAGITWGSFMGGFDLGAHNPNGTTGCARSTQSEVVGKAVPDYIPHHAWFQYHASTANPSHARPASLATIGYSFEVDGKTADPAKHQYDLADFYAAVKAGNFPSVSYIKMPAYQDGHAGYSDPLDEQAGTVDLLNFLQRQRDWKNTAVLITWDDSDGWYDHAYHRPIHASFDAQADQVTGPGRCGTGTPPQGIGGKPVNGRCGPGTRIPFLVISPWARVNFVDHALISQASVLRFIEDNWLHGKRLGGGSFDASAGSLMGMFNFAAHRPDAKLFLDPRTGEVLKAPPASTSN